MQCLRAFFLLLCLLLIAIVLLAFSAVCSCLVTSIYTGQLSGIHEKYPGPMDLLFKAWRGDAWNRTFKEVEWDLNAQNMW